MHRIESGLHIHVYIFFLRKAKIWRGFFFVDGYRMVLTNDGKCNVNAGKRPIKLWSFVQTILGVSKK